MNVCNWVYNHSIQWYIKTLLYRKVAVSMGNCWMHLCGGFRYAVWTSFLFDMQYFNWFIPGYVRYEQPFTKGEWYSCCVFVVLCYPLANFTALLVCLSLKTDVIQLVDGWYMPEHRTQLWYRNACNADLQVVIKCLTSFSLNVVAWQLTCISSSKKRSWNSMRRLMSIRVSWQMICRAIRAFGRLVICGKIAKNGRLGRWPLVGWFIGRIGSVHLPSAPTRTIVNLPTPLK